MNLTLLISALIAVESGGNDHAVGRHGEVGCLQIRPAVVRDVNRIYGLWFKSEHCFKRVDSIYLFKHYIGHYCTRERLGHEPTLEDAARIWNGGPNGWRNPKTLKYWRKVKKELEKSKP